MFPYLPLSGAGNRQWVIERAKLEYALSHALKIGVGYGGYQFGGQPWQHKPFATATITPVHGKLGSLELWLQKLPHGKAQVQIRYELVHIGKKR